ncbi:MAG: amino acid adenylation domain-containing protein [Anaerolineales bacterium]
MAYLLQHILREGASRFGDQIAVRFGDWQWTYAELDRRSSQLARSLRELSVRRGDRVGIYLHKSLASVLSVFGILKAGGVYVPLDARAPAARLAYITRNCDIRVIVTSAECAAEVEALLREETPVQAVVLTEAGPLGEPLPVAPRPGARTVVAWDEVARGEASPLGDDGTIETDLAYILYTSGSTGEPKGVMISHRTIFTFLRWAVDTFRMGPDDRVTSHAPLHFDLSTLDIFATLLAGGTVVLVPEGLSTFPVRLVKLLHDERITLTYLVPSVLTLMVTYGRLDAHDLSALRTILFAGEVFPIKYLRKLAAKVPHVELYNLYGPTETNVCTYYQVGPADLDPERQHPVPIGRACENTEVFAVDESGQRVDEPGREGELWVRGSTVAQGYWGDRPKTAGVFVANPLQPHVQEVAYRTGDVVCLEADGVTWRYLGRRDHMVKSRGYRIELGEIEAALYSHAGVREAVAVAVPDELVGSRIKAYVVRLGDNGVSAADLDSHCRERLPRYMVPESLEFLEELPKTSSGKVDRSQLAERQLGGLGDARATLGRSG